MISGSSRRRMREALGLAVTVAVLVAAAATVGSAAHAQDVKRLVWAQALPTGCLDPAFQSRLPDWGNIKNIYSGLLNHVPGTLNEPGPDLAERWEVSDDDHTYTFHLREGVQWHDGYGEVTAEDVKYSWERLLDPATGAVSNADLQVVESIEVIDPLTVQVTLEEPSPSFLNIIANSAYVFVVNQQAIEERGDAHCTQPVGSGPYRVAFAEVGGGVVLEAVDHDHHLGRPAIQEVEMRVIPEESVAVLALMRGDIDFMFVREYHNMRQLMDAPGVALNADPDASTSTYLAPINTQREPFTDVRVRRALVLATDREAFAAALSDGLVTEPTHTFIPPTMLGHTEDVRRYPYDPEEARRLLAEAGFPDGFSTSIQVLNTGFHPTAAVLLQEMWREVGIDLEIDLLDLGVVRERQATGDMSITLSSRGVVDVHQTLYADFHSELIGSQANYSRYANPEVDRMIEAQASEMDPVRRAEIIEEVQRILAEDVPAIPLKNVLRATAAREHVTGLIPDIGWWRTHFYWMDIEQ